MGVMLDLSAYKEETADIRMTDDTVLHLKKPSEKMVIHMLQLREIDQDSPPLTIMATLNAIALEILNNNADGLEFQMDSVAAMSTDIKTRILTAYSDWAVELQSNPTTARPASPGGAKQNRTRKPKSRRWFTPWRNTRG